MKKEMTMENSRAVNNVIVRILKRAAVHGYTNLTDVYERACEDTLEKEKAAIERAGSSLTSCPFSVH